MIGEAIPPILTDIVAFCAAALVLLAFTAAVSRLRWVRWIWRRLVSGPLGEWTEKRIGGGVQRFHDDRVQPAIDKIQADIADIRKELKTNDGSTLRDAIVRTERTADRAESVARQIAAGQGIALPAGVDPTERPAT